MTHRAQVLLLDLEGTIYTRDGLITGASEAIAQLRTDGHTLRFLTNTDSAATADLLIKVRTMGIDIADGELFTPVGAVRALVDSEASIRLLTLTTPAVRTELAEGFELAETSESATHVIVGDVRTTLDYALLDAAFAALHDGATLVALQRGRFFLSGGQPHLDTGAVVAALEYAAGVKAQVVGKPSPRFLELALSTIKGNPSREDIWVVGDDRTTDIPMALAAGAHAVQVRTGKFALQDDESAKASFVVDSIADVPRLIRTQPR
ncbi:HAD-IIA family hydrolase [Jonesia quinghaiensis]|uniref:HAD-IIA family hydrolase n=1 Tax=Jonesia quinghaiensis TaxID=262806 RepID=UPI00041423A2|nr:HAD hydrolase-like protein [Jonesia quinghaiensis]